MANKEIKSHLKAARTSIDAKKYEEAIEKCQVVSCPSLIIIIFNHYISQMVFAIDASNYQAHVFAGLAALQLGRQEEAKQHYQSAITIAPHEQLAWKVPCI